jgi:hypothetical protein
MEIIWLGHGSFEFRLPSGQVILMDPWIDGNPAYPKTHTIQRADLICISHGHFDHIHSTPALAQRFSPQVVAIFETCQWLESKGVKNTRPMNKGGSQKVGEVALTMTHAVHSCGILDNGQIVYGGEAAGYVLRFADGRALYFAGDTNVFSDMHLVEQLYHPELAYPAHRRSLHHGPARSRRWPAGCSESRRRSSPCTSATFPPLTGTPAQLTRTAGWICATEVWALEPGKSGGLVGGVIAVTPEGKLKHAPPYWLTHLATSSMTFRRHVLPGLAVVRLGALALAREPARGPAPDSSSA